MVALHRICAALGQRLLVDVVMCVSAADRMSNVVLLSDDELDIDEARRTVMSAAAGAVSVFIGLLLCLITLLNMTTDFTVSVTVFFHSYLLIVLVLIQSF